MGAKGSEVVDLEEVDPKGIGSEDVGSEEEVDEVIGRVESSETDTEMARTAAGRNVLQAAILARQMPRLMLLRAGLVERERRCRVGHEGCGLHAHSSPESRRSRSAPLLGLCSPLGAQVNAERKPGSHGKVADAPGDMTKY